MTAGREQDARETLVRAALLSHFHGPGYDFHPAGRGDECQTCTEAAEVAVAARLPSPPATTGADAGVTALLAAAQGTKGWGEHVRLTPEDVADWLRGRAEEWPTHPWAASSPPAADGDAADGGTR